MPPNRLPTPEEKEKKLEILATLAEIYQCRFSEKSFESMVEALEGFTAENLEKASKIHIQTQRSFSVRNLLDIIEQNNLYTPIPHVKLPGVKTQEEAHAFLQSQEDPEFDD